MQRAILICGPTASGKTDYAHNLAQKNNGSIINIDSMQIYKQIPIITASPSEKYKNEIPYHLYNFLDIQEEFSVVKYVNTAVKVIREESNKGKLPIIIGGSGLYINALLYGYNEIPVILPEIRKSVRELQASMSNQKFFDGLKKIDASVEGKLLPSDTQRIIRAYEVCIQTGKSIFAWQQQDNIIPLPEFNFEVIFLWPERSLLHKNCNDRVVQMFHGGAAEEITHLLENFKGVSDSALKAVGIREIISYLKNEINLLEAIKISQDKTRQYAKRQITWFKNQIKEKKIIQYNSKEEFFGLL